MSSQKWATLIIVLAAGILLGSEYVLVRWYPGYKERAAAAALKALPYQSSSLGINMQVAAGFYGNVEDFAGGVRIYRMRLLGTDPSITITTEPNPDGASQFTPTFLALVETRGTRRGIPGYQFQHLTLAGRDAYIVSQYDPGSRSTIVTAHILAPDRIVKATCNAGGSESVYEQACNQSLDSITVSGPPSKIVKPPPIQLENAR